jgi:hypothetical protein
MSTSTELLNTIINQVPFLRTSREFPEEAQRLCQEVNKSYVDIAGAVNDRVIGLFPSNRPAITGKRYFLTPGRVNQSLRQVYRFTSFTSPMSIPHGINFIDVAHFSEIYGTAFDGTNYYPLPYIDVVSATNQINVIITPTNIIITAGAGSPPAITSGLITLEWLVN